MRQMPAFITTSIVALTLYGCASESSQIEATYVSPLKFNSYSCSQLEQEYARVLGRSLQINKQQDDIASNDAVATGVGLLLWPALFFIKSDDLKEEVGRLKGEVNAIEESSVQKNCLELSKRVVDDRERLRKAAEEKKKQQQEEFK